MQILETDNLFVKAIPAACVAATFSSTFSTGVLHFGAGLVVMGSFTKVADEVGDYISKELVSSRSDGITYEQHRVLQKLVKTVSMVAFQSIALYVASSLGGTLCFTVDLLSFETCFLVSMINKAAWGFFGKFYDAREGNQRNLSHHQLRTPQRRKFFLNE